MSERRELNDIYDGFVTFGGAEVAYELGYSSDYMRKLLSKYPVKEAALSYMSRYVDNAVNQYRSANGIPAEPVAYTDELATLRKTIQHALNGTYTVHEVAQKGPSLADALIKVLDSALVEKIYEEKNAIVHQYPENFKIHTINYEGGINDAEQALGH